MGTLSHMYKHGWVSKCKRNLTVNQACAHTCRLESYLTHQNIVHLSQLRWRLWMLMSIEFAVSSDIGLATHSAGRWLCAGAYRGDCKPWTWLHGVLYQNWSFISTRVCHVPVWCRMIDLTERPYKPRTDSVSIPLSVLTTTENYEYQKVHSCQPTQDQGQS